MTKEEKYQKIAEDVLQAVGGKENVFHVTHCMTRLRFNLKDESIPNQDEIKKNSRCHWCNELRGTISSYHWTDRR